MNRGAFCFLIVLIASAALRGAERISVEARISGKEALSNNLSPSDFELRENGKPQRVEASYIGSGAPDRAGLWIYIAVDIFAREYPNTQQAILKFIDGQLKPGVMVSLGGAPFTDRATDLRKLLMPGPALSEDSISGREVAGLLPMWNVGYNAILNGRPIIDRYTVLTQQLGVLPGKKAVVLFRDSLRLDQDGLDSTTPQPDSATIGAARPTTRLPTSTVGGLNAEPGQHARALERLSSEALRNRVAFYPVRALGGNLGDYGAQGLNQIANVTGGEAVLTEGDPAVIFSRLLHDAGDYYLLSYEPSDPSERGRKRRISVKVNRKGLKASVRIDEYLERRPGEEPTPQRVAAVATAPDAFAVDNAAMRELLIAGEKADFPLDVSHAVFRGSDGKAVVIYAAAVHPGELKTVDSGDSVQADFSLAALAFRDGAEAAFASVREKRSFPADEFKRALNDKRMRTHYTAALRGIEAGSYELRVAWKDQNGGRASSAKLLFSAPDFEIPLAASSLMITRDAVNGPPEIGNPLGELLAVGDTHFLPDSSTTFAPGETLYVVYHLYAVPEGLLAQPPPVQFVVMQNQQPVSNAPAGGDAIAMKDQNQIRYRVMVQTDQLKPGTYTALVGLPQAGGGEPRILTKEFVIE